ncbi:acyl-CoA synthetase [Rhizobium sullae]|uniref:acyl-CoA synthetase n=1 Tax=Rhizobium sullae TaxID=50338 RepID=UPI000B3537D5|nr:long-chain fatty acid--CoA ligase [Rhizobium sullae]
MNVFSLLDQIAARHPQQGAVFLGDQQVWTFAQLRSRALKIAAALHRSFQIGDRIAVMSENRPEYIELFFGIWAAGMAATPVNVKLHVKEAVQILEDSGAAAVFVSPKLASGLVRALDGSSVANCRPIVIGEGIYQGLFREEWGQPVPASPEALAWLFYTSGTTGRSKGAMLSHRNLLAMTVAHLADIDSPNANASLIHAAPMSHGSGLYIPAYIARGARQVVPASAGFDPLEFMDLCETHAACSVFLAPTMVQRLRQEADRSGRVPANLRTIVYGGGPMYVEELRKSLAVFGPVFAQIYGQGESPMTITGLPREEHVTDDDAILGSVGFARSGVEVAVVTADGKSVRPGEIGEIVCRGDVVMSGYWNNENATTEALRDGWLFTGDMGSFDENGYLTLRDRSKDVVISGGANIYPREVEEALLKHADVQEVSVVGQPDPEWGEIVVAFIVPRPGSVPDDASLDAHCNSQIARFKRPKRYVYLNELPKNNYGKVLKRELRDKLIAAQLK